MYVYVLNKNNQPLMPTIRAKHVRELLNSGKAVVLNSNPFTIKLKYETEDIIQYLYCGMDTGRENIGVAVSNEVGECVFRGILQTNNKTIKQNMEDRKALRNERRRHKRQKKQRKALKNIWCHKEALKKMMEILPISHFILENVSFDFQKLEDENIDDWNHGPLFGFENYKDYINYQQHGKCLMCDNKINHYHHIVSKSEGGSNSVSNIAGLCKDHHDLVHKDKEFRFLLSELKEGNKQKYKVSLLNTIMPFLIEELKSFCEENNIDFKVTNGYQTYLTREKCNFGKNHDIDAYAVSLFDRDVKKIDVGTNCYQLRRFKKKSNNSISKLGQREYYYNDELVAINRHKATHQMDNSLEEFIQQFDDKEKILKELIVKPAKRIYSYRKYGKDSNFHPGDIVKFYKKNKIDGKEYKDRFVVLNVDNNNKSLYYTTTKNRRMKYCQRIKSGAIQFIT